MFELMPFGREEKSIWNMLDQFDRNFFRNDGMMAAFKTDVTDEGDHYLLQADLPGFKKEDIHIDLEGENMTIRAQHSEENEQKDEKKNYICRERRFGSYARSFDVSGIDVQQISAQYHDGVLEMKLPKVAQEQPQRKQIAIE